MILLSEEEKSYSEEKAQWKGEKSRYLENLKCSFVLVKKSSFLVRHTYETM